MTDIKERLRAQITDDHERGCMGRNYGCTCGYDEKTEELLEEAAAEIERLHEITQQQARRLKEKDAEIERLREESTKLRYQIGDAVCRERGAREAMEKQLESEIERLKEKS